MTGPTNTMRPDGTRQGAGISRDDVLYILFRHKWLISVLSVLGIAAAAALYVTWPKNYVSQAKLLIRYIVESKAESAVQDSAQVRPVDSRGDSIINSEVEILNSLDLAVRVVEAVGPSRILGKAGGGSNPNLAAEMVRRNLKVESSKNSSVIRISFTHPDPEMAQVVLKQLVEEYLKRHVEIHRSKGLLDEFLTLQTGQLETSLKQAEEALWKLKTNTGVFSVEESRKSYIEQVSRIRQEMLNAQAELVERRAALSELQKFTPTNVVVAVTNQQPVPPQKLDEYRNVCVRLESYRRREQDLLTQFSVSNILVKAARELVAEAEKEKQSLESDFPSLLQFERQMAQKSASGSDRSAAGPDFGLTTEMARILALEAKIKVLNSQLEEVRKESETIEQVEPSIVQLQRKKEMEEARYRQYQASLERSRIDERLGSASSGRISNIAVVQSASPAMKEESKRKKVVGMALGGAIAGSIALAFLIEMFLRQSVRRTSDVESRLNLPLMLTIPEIKDWRSVNGPSKSSPPKDAESAASTRETESLAVPGGNGSWPVAPWEPGHGLHIYHEALRDRLISYFEVRNMTHKPKLVAVTGCHHGAGVTTLAAGLAASLSETGDGNVLLVDMNSSQGSAHPFYRGKPGCGLSDVLEGEKRDPALVQENLYVASANVAPANVAASHLPRVLPKRFNHLVPKMKASDFDYIIFDMPPVNQTSVTPRLSSSMDMVVMVLGSEKTGAQSALKAKQLLQESRANVTTVLNRHRDYLPSWLREAS